MGTGYFFSNEHPGAGRLFEGLSIWKEDVYRDLQGSYPVIFVSFANIKGATYEVTRKIVARLIVNLYNKYDFLKDGDFLNENETEFFDSVNTEMTDDIAALSLYQLSMYLSRYYGRKGRSGLGFTMGLRFGDRRF